MSMSSFRKREVQKPIEGTRTSPQTGQLITSSGNPSLDALLGGGLPIGSIYLIEEDKYSIHSKVLTKYFLAEGLCSNHACFLGSLDEAPLEILRKLPRPVAERHDSLEKEDGTPKDKGLRIAWRYNDLPIINSEQSTTKIGHNFNLMKCMPLSPFYFRKILTWSSKKKLGVVECLDSINENFQQLDTQFENNFEATELENIFKNQNYLKIIEGIQYLVHSKKPEFLEKSLSRICITSLGSPLWYDENFSSDILKFLTLLRVTIRNMPSVCLLTIPMNLIRKLDKSLVDKIRNLVDFSIELESFAGSVKELNPAFKEYNGLVRLHKVTAINNLSAYMPDTNDLAFKLRRKKFVIERLHLPPELQGTDKTKKKNADAVPNIGCGSSELKRSPVSLDF